MIGKNFWAVRDGQINHTTKKTINAHEALP